MPRARDDIDLHSIARTLAGNMSLLREKRHTIREAALESINNFLCMKYCNDVLDARQEILIQGLKKSMQGQHKEVLLALKCIALSCITLQDNADFFQYFQDILLTLIHEETHSFSSEVKSTAIETLTTCWFIVLSVSHLPSSQQTATTIMIMDGLELLFHAYSSNHELCSYALNGWNLLLTTLRDAKLIRELFKRNIAKLVDHLDSADVEVRDASSKSVAVLAELMKNEDEDAPNPEGIESPPDWTEVLERLNTIFGDKSNYVSKLERKKHRSMIHQIINYLESDISPSEEIVIRNFQLHLDNWRQILQMQRLRAVIGDGFLIHLAENPTLMSIFDYEIAASVPVAPAISKRARRLSFGPSSEGAKAFTKVKAALRRRGTKEHGVAALLEDPGE